MIHKPSPQALFLKVEFVALSFENGSPVLRMKTADGVETKVVHKVPRNVSLCDGHWHHIKVFLLPCYWC